MDSVTPYGFVFGAATVTRICKDKDRVWIDLSTPRHPGTNSIQIHVTKTGKVRIFSNGEWAPPKRTKK